VERATKKSQKLLFKYHAHLQVILRDLHFFGLQAAEDYLEGHINTAQYEQFMNDSEASLERYLLIVRKIKKFPTSTIGGA
jgi:hypothetical protein